MYCLVITDLHLDYFFGQRMDPFSNLPSTAFDGITHCIIAGDLSNKAHKQWKRCLPWVADKMPGAKIYMMSGNHDYYNFQIDQEDRLREVAAAHGATFLQKSEANLGHPPLPLRNAMDRF